MKHGPECPLLHLTDMEPLGRSGVRRETGKE